MIIETLIIHGGDLVEWHAASGYDRKPAQRIAPTELSIEFTTSPRTLRVHHKPDGTVLWHQNSAGPSLAVAGMASGDDLAAQPITTYPIRGRVSDPAGRYLPRTFAFTLGNITTHTVALYHSPLGARFGAGGGIYGRLAFEPGTAAAWAMITLTVTPALGVPLRFVAQADQYGEFRLPLERLPAMTKDAPSSTHNARLEVRALPGAHAAAPLDPDSLIATKVAKGKSGNGKSQFADFLTLAISPGSATRVVSPEHTQIVLQST